MASLRRVGPKRCSQLGGAPPPGRCVQTSPEAQVTSNHLLDFQCCPCKFIHRIRSCIRTPCVVRNHAIGPPATSLLYLCARRAVLDWMVGRADARQMTADRPGIVEPRCLGLPTTNTCDFLGQQCREGGSIRLRPGASRAEKGAFADTSSCLPSANARHRFKDDESVIGRGAIRFVFEKSTCSD